MARKELTGIKSGTNSLPSLDKLPLILTSEQVIELVQAGFKAVYDIQIDLADINLLVRQDHDEAWADGARVMLPLARTY